MSKIKKLRKKKPKFPRLNSSVKRLDTSKWRRPKGHSGRVKRGLSHKKGKSPKIGRKLPSEIRHKHISGMEIVEVSNTNDLKNIDKKKQMIKILNVGKKKKIDIVKNAISKGIKISNLRKPEEFISKIRNKNNKKSD